jgi:hypothetical protein
MSDNITHKHDLLIHTVASKYILGENIDIQIKGKKEQLICLNELLDASKKLYQSLNDTTTPLQQIMSLVEHKKTIADKFKKISGITWKL